MRVPRVPLSVALIWVVAIVLVALGKLDVGKAVVLVAFVSIGALFGFRPGGTGGPTDSSTGSSGGPGAST